jgi:hypothetical protein
MAAGLPIERLPIERLPIELHLDIFERLEKRDFKSLSFVCRDWRPISQRLLFRTFISYKDSFEGFMNAIIGNKSLGSTTRSIKIEKCAVWPEPDGQPNIFEDLPVLLPFVPHLRYLMIPMHKKFLQKFKDALETGLILMKDLQQLHIIMNDAPPAEPMVYSFIRHLPRLSDLTVTFMYGGCSLEDSLIVPSSVSIQRLKLDGCCLEKSALRLLLQNCRLEDFDYCHHHNYHSRDDETICDKHFNALDLHEELVSHTHTLAHLAVSFPAQVSVKKFEPLKSFINLRTLKLDEGHFSERPSLPQSLEELFVSCIHFDFDCSLFEYLTQQANSRLSQLQLVCIKLPWASPRKKLPNWIHEKIHLKSRLGCACGEW